MTEMAQKQGLFFKKSNTVGDPDQMHSPQERGKNKRKRAIIVSRPLFLSHLMAVKGFKMFNINVGNILSFLIGIYSDRYLLSPLSSTRISKLVSIML